MFKHRLRFFVALSVLVSSFVLIAGADQANADVKVKTKTTYYKVSGADGKSLSENMLNEGKKNISLSHAIAATQYKFDFGAPKIGTKNGKCVVKDVDVFLNIEYIFPKWTNQRGASRAVKANWATFYRELQAHEKRHGEIAIKGAKELEREILKFSGFKAIGCRDMGTFAAFKLSNIIRKTRNEQQAFDRREYNRSSKISKLQISLYKAS